MKHTPGPWKVGFRMGSGCRYIFAPIMEKVRSGAEVEVDQIILEDADKQLSEEDAQLIAAAPELLAILSLAVRTINDTLRHGLTAGQLDALAEVTDKASETIARAEGQP